METADEDDPQWGEHEIDGEEESSELSPGQFELILAALTVLVRCCLAALFGPSGGETAGRKRKAAAQPDAAAPTGGACRRCSTCSGPREVKARVRVKSGGCVVRLQCGGCRSFEALPKGEISVGDVIAFEGRLWLVRSLRDRKHHGGEDRWHVQGLSKYLEVPAEPGDCYEILGDAALRLTRDHQDIPLQAFAAAWPRGEADALGRCQLFYSSRDGCYDQLAVPAQCPGFDCCRAADGRDCGCLNPWAVRGGGGDVYHPACKPLPASRPPELVALAGRPVHHPPVAGCSCRINDITYSPGDLAWLLPPGSPEVDAQLELVRIQRFFRPTDYPSQDVEGLPSEVWGTVAVEYQPYSCTDSVLGFEYRPMKEVEVWRADQLHGLYEDGRRAPGSRVAGSATTVGSAANAPSAGCGSAGTPGSLQAAVGCGEGECGAGACDVTPTASDSTAHVSWRSNGSDASSGRAQSGASSAHVPGGSLPEGAQAGSSLGTVVVGSTFCGCGGLDIGLKQGLPGADARWACDMYLAALQTYAGHSPGTRIHAEDVCSFLQAIRSSKKDYPRIGCPAGEWRIFVGGPPCQGFSRANTNGDEAEKAKKNILVGVFLSVLEVLQWPFAIMENVVGLLAAGDLMQRIMQWAVSSGYQVSFRVLNTASYGVPQHRRRVIVFFAKAHLPMPFHPEPTHVFRGAGGYQGSSSCTWEDRLKAACRGVPVCWRANVTVPRHAPLPAITVKDAIGDLPLQSGATAYSSAPHSYYAACMRAGGASAVGAPLHNHETCQVDGETLRRVAHIPKEGHQPRPRGASSVPHPFFPIRSGNWLDLPPELRTPAMNAAREGVARCLGMFARLQWGSHFATVLTNPALNSHSTSTFIHPEADRPLTQREAARAQGFPDSIQFQGTPADGYKQIGNAVPPPLAAALGRELARVMRLAQRQQQQQQ